MPNENKGNIYKLDEEYGIGWTSNTNREFYFDLEDYNLIQHYTWREAHDKNGYHYICTSIHVGDKCYVLKMHELITEYKYCEHADKNPFNNRQANLRESSHAENMQNKSTYKNNTSGFPGVTWHSRNNKWEASIRFNGKNHHLGYFLDYEDAVLARLRGEARYFDPKFASHRDVFEKFEIDVDTEKNKEEKRVSVTNTSGVTGVIFNKDKQKWYAQLCYNKKRVSSSYYIDKQDAIIARLTMELEYYGFDNAPQRHLFKEYGITDNKENKNI